MTIKGVSMAFLEWNENLSVMVPEMDSQHKRLVSLFNELDDAMKQGKGKEVMGKVLNGLVSYVNTHFKAEEEFMKKIGFTELEQHQVEHKKLTEEVENFYNDFKQGKAIVSVQIMNFLRNWLIDHIMKKDKRYGEFAKQKH